MSRRNRAKKYSTYMVEGVTYFNIDERIQYTLISDTGSHIQQYITLDDAIKSAKNYITMSGAPIKSRLYRIVDRSGNTVATVEYRESGRMAIAPKLENGQECEWYQDNFIIVSRRTA